ncbi:MAG TPA: hypothetical protein PLU50_11905, partial [Pseudobdellovibrionaceae bacterium]|nr:hypothetical protein [Pseudobdellovibrionaceae bacterium]
IERLKISLIELRVCWKSIEQFLARRRNCEYIQAHNQIYAESNVRKSFGGLFNRNLCSLVVNG